MSVIGEDCPKPQRIQGDYDYTLRADGVVLTDAAVGACHIPYGPLQAARCFVMLNEISIEASPTSRPAKRNNKPGWIESDSKLTSGILVTATDADIESSSSRYTRLASSLILLEPHINKACLKVAEAEDIDPHKAMILQSVHITVDPRRIEARTRQLKAHAVIGIFTPTGSRTTAWLRTT